MVPQVSNYANNQVHIKMRVHSSLTNLENEWRLRVLDQIGTKVDQVDYTVISTEGLCIYVNESSMEVRVFF